VAAPGTRDDGRGVRALMQTAYLAIFFGVFAFFAVWEAGSPRLPFNGAAARWRHIVRNIALFAVLMVVTNVLLRWVLPGMTLSILDAPRGLVTGWGLSLPVQVIFGVLVLDLYHYAFHRLCHHNRWLWRLHRVHHADAHLDVSTGMRFHPLETTLSLVLKLTLLALLGLPLWVEAVRVLAINPLAFAHHANVKFPEWLERWGRPLVVTPALHRLHHSINPHEYDRNFGEFLSCWDRWFGTYRIPSGNAEHVGLPGFEDQRWQTFTGMLTMPWSAPQSPERV
jgi:sterol desaturase/sphingolipid hydroxylase (fatty acid hydroxylase superfamily)